MQQDQIIQKQICYTKNASNILLGKNFLNNCLLMQIHLKHVARLNYKLASLTSTCFHLQLSHLSYNFFISVLKL